MVRISLELDAEMNKQLKQYALDNYDTPYGVQQEILRTALSEFLDRHRKTFEPKLTVKPALKEELNIEDKIKIDKLYKKRLDVGDIAKLVDSELQLVNLYLLENHDDYVYGVGKQVEEKIKKNQSAAIEPKTLITAPKAPAKPKGNKSKTGRKKGFKMTPGIKELMEKRWAELELSHPDMSKNAKMVLIAQEFGCSKTSVGNCIEPMLKKESNGAT